MARRSDRHRLRPIAVLASKAATPRLARGARLSMLARRTRPPYTGRIYDRSRLDGPDVTAHSLENREESIYGVPGLARRHDAQAAAAALCAAEHVEIRAVRVAFIDDTLNVRCRRGALDSHRIADIEISGRGITDAKQRPIVVVSLNLHLDRRNRHAKLRGCTSCSSWRDSSRARPGPAHRESGRRRRRRPAAGLRPASTGLLRFLTGQAVADARPAHAGGAAERGSECQRPGGAFEGNANPVHASPPRPNGCGTRRE